MKRSRNFESAAYAGRARPSCEGSRRARRMPRGWNNWHRSTSPRHLSSRDERCSRGVEARDDPARRRHRTLTVWRPRRRPTSHIRLEEVKCARAVDHDVTALDCVGNSSEFNSCLSADITSYAAPSCTLPSLSDHDMQTCISSLRDAVDVELASRLCHKLSHLNAPRFPVRRLHLPCIVFPVTEVRWRRGEDQQRHSTIAVSFRGQDPLGKFSCSSIHEIICFLRCGTL